VDHLDLRMRALFLARSIDCIPEGRQPICCCLPTCETDVGGNEPAQRVAHISERSCGLHESTERKSAGKETRRRHDKRNHHRDLVIAGGKPGQAPLPPDDRPPIGKNLRESRAKASELIRLTTVERDSLDIISESHEAVAKVRLEALLREIQNNERLADEVCQSV